MAFWLIENQLLTNNLFLTLLIVFQLKINQAKVDLSMLNYFLKHVKHDEWNIDNNASWSTKLNWALQLKWRFIYNSNFDLTFWMLCLKMVQFATEWNVP